MLSVRTTGVIGRRSAPGALAGTTGRFGITGETRSYGAPCAGRLSCSPLLGHNAIARSACALMDRDGFTPRFAEMAAPSVMCSVG